MKINKQPVIYIVIFNFLAFGLLYAMIQNINVLYTGLISLTLTVVTYAIIKQTKMGDIYLFLIVSMLVTIGLLMLCRLNYSIGFKQICWYIISLAVFFASYFIYKFAKNLDKLRWFYLILSCVLFIVTLIFGVAIGGAKNWISILGKTFQPSEFIKVLFILYLSSYYCSEKNKKIKNIDEKYINSASIYVFLGFLVLQREWGISVLFFITYILMEYIFENDKLIILGNTVLAIIGGSIGALTLYHIQVRITTWLNPWNDVANKGYQITQSLFAIASGGFLGTGIGLGKPEFIPEVHSDFIFSAICEEMGLFGGVAIILLYFIFVYRGIKIALLLPEGFDRCVTVGITTMFGIQTFIIIGGVIKFIPLTGITLPFISYGGSSLMSCFICLGILQAISSKEVI